MPKQIKSSPLWLIGLFVLFAEAMSAVSAMKLTGWPQSAMVVFVICYSTVVTLVFFLFLWFKPENFYSPSEYGDVSPELFIQALKGVPLDTKDAIKEFESNPLNQETRFNLMDRLLQEDIKQHLILMLSLNGELDVSNRNQLGWTHSYQILTRNKGVSIGHFQPDKFYKMLYGTDLIDVVDGNRKFKLTPLGREFASWLKRNEKDASSFWTGIGGWGDKKDLKELMMENMPAPSGANA